MVMKIAGRYERQSSIVTRADMARHTPVVIGCGAVGSVVARQLAHMGSDVVLVDFDVVGPENLSCQGFREGDLHKPKVEALAEALREINSEITIATVMGEFDPATLPVPPTAVFCCVDSISTRGAIFETVSSMVDFFVDGRMKGGDTVGIFTARRDVPESMIKYPGTIFPAAEAQAGACTAKTTIYGAYLAGALMVHEYVRFLKAGGVFEPCFYQSLPATELTIAGGVEEDWAEEPVDKEYLAAQAAPVAAVEAPVLSAEEAATPFSG
jgi:sulfur carrier protein ThiS adenylyltransferase